MIIKGTISNLLIFISIIATLVANIFPIVYIFGMNNTFLDQGLYHIFIIQFFTGSFLHGGLIHLLANSIFIYFFGNIVEGIIGKTKFIIFFIFVTVFNGIGLSLFYEGNTVGISGFCMALIAYYTLELRSRNNPEYKGGITAIILNVGIGLMPGISLLGHLFGAIAGVIYYILTKDFFRKKWVGSIDIEEI